jgi:hypothetical protein
MTWGLMLRATSTRPYAQDLQRIYGFVVRSARGVPTGAHAAFKTFAVDAVTLRAVRQGRTLLHFSAQRKHCLLDTLGG